MRLFSAAVEKHCSGAHRGGPDSTRRSESALTVGRVWGFDTWCRITVISLYHEICVSVCVCRFEGKKVSVMFLKGQRKSSSACELNLLGNTWRLSWLLGDVLASEIQLQDLKHPPPLLFLSCCWMVTEEVYGGYVLLRQRRKIEVQLLEWSGHNHLKTKRFPLWCKSLRGEKNKVQNLLKNVSPVNTHHHHLEGSLFTTSPITETQADMYGRILHPL